MMGFVVPIKPKNISKDWLYENKLLERTVISICSQTDQDFKLIIVYNDLPQIVFEHPNILMVHYPYKTISVSEIEDFDDYVSKYYSREYAEKMMDKGKKITYGCKTAKELGCKYIMAVDSDDLVSNRITHFVNRHSHTLSAGWRITKGFIYEEGSSILIKKYDIQNINGSTHIIREDIISIPDFSSNIFWNYNLFESHGYAYFRVRDYHKETLEDLPFFGIIYMVHKNNYSSIQKLTSTLTLKKIAKRILLGKWITSKIRNEFKLVAVS